MTRWLAKSIGDAIKRNDIDLLVERDLKEPFRDETRKAKRNLITAGFAAIVVAALDVRFNNFVGLSANGGEIAADITRGLACLAVIYFLFGYVVDAVLDYTAWRIGITKLRITPYLALIRSVEHAFRVSSEQLFNALNAKDEKSSLGQLTAIEKHQSERMEEVRPLLADWQRTLRALSFQVSARRATRAVRMWGWDFLVPLAIAGVAIARTADGLSAAVLKLLGVV